MTKLAGRVVVIGAGDPSAREAALACVENGAVLVIVAGDDAAVAADIARESGAVGGRVAVFIGSLASAPDREALAEMVAELS